MCGKGFWKRIISFVVFFIIGILFTSFFVSTKSRPVKSQQSLNIESQSLVFNSLKPSKAENKQRRCESFDSSDFKKYKNFSVEKLKAELDKIISTSPDKGFIIFGNKSDWTPREWEANQERQRFMERKILVLQFLIEKEGKAQDSSYLYKCYE